MRARFLKPTDSSSSALPRAPANSPLGKSDADARSSWDGSAIEGNESEGNETEGIENEGSGRDIDGSDDGIEIDESVIVGVELDDNKVVRDGFDRRERVGDGTNDDEGVRTGLDADGVEGDLEPLHPGPNASLRRALLRTSNSDQASSWEVTWGKMST